jgi:hypothetical protein
MSWFFIFCRYCGYKWLECYIEGNRHCTSCCQVCQISLFLHFSHSAHEGLLLKLLFIYHYFPFCNCVASVSLAVYDWTWPYKGRRSGWWHNLCQCRRYSLILFPLKCFSFGYFHLIVMMNNNFFINLRQISLMLAGEMLHVAQAFIDKNYHPTVAQACDGRTKQCNGNVWPEEPKYRGIIVRYLWGGSGKHNNARSISKWGHDKFILDRALSRSKNHTSSLDVLCCSLSQ